MPLQNICLCFCSLLFWQSCSPIDSLLPKLLVQGEASVVAEMSNKWAKDQRNHFAQLKKYFSLVFPPAGAFQWHTLCSPSVLMKRQRMKKSRTLFLWRGLHLVRCLDNERMALAKIGFKSSNDSEDFLLLHYKRLTRPNRLSEDSFPAVFCIPSMFFLKNRLVLLQMNDSESRCVETEVLLAASSQTKFVVKQKTRNLKSQPERGERALEQI